MGQMFQCFSFFFLSVLRVFFFLLVSVGEEGEGAFLAGKLRQHPGMRNGHLMSS